MKKWKILNKTKKFGKDKLIKILLENRGIKTKKEIEVFLNPKLSDVTASSVDIDKTQLKKTMERIKKAILAKEQIIVFGDYDVDGICGTAILWETLNELGAKVMPYIPHRMDEGYGLSRKGISNVKSQIPNIKLIITVDNGIVANDAVDFANENGIDVIITDHHVPSQKIPKAQAIVHTTRVCGTGVAYLLSQEISNFKFQISNKSQNLKSKIENNHLELVALATIADLVLLKGANRTFVKFGIDKLRKTKRIGLLAIIEEAGIDKEIINTYEIGHIIAPRLNAMGRLEYAMDSLRLLCTKDKDRAKNLAHKLGSTNRRRQEMTIQSFEHAKASLKSQIPSPKSLIFLADESYQQGVIGLIAGRLVEEFYRPAIVVSKGEKLSRASARSVSGFNIIEFIRNASDFLVDAGGHPMAAGFTVETEKLFLVQEKLEKLAEKLLNTKMLTQSLRIDCEIGFSLIENNLYDVIQGLAPFGMGNPKPTFVSRKIIIEDSRLVGVDGKHLKLKLSQLNSPIQFDAIGFGMGEMSEKIRIGDKIDLVYQIEQNEWPARNALQRMAGGNGNSKLQLKIKDLRKSSG